MSSYLSSITRLGEFASISYSTIALLTLVVLYGA